VGAASNHLTALNLRIRVTKKVLISVKVSVTNKKVYHELLKVLVYGLYLAGLAERLLQDALF